MRLRYRDVWALAVLLVPCIRTSAAEGRFERMAALQETVVSVHERGGMPGLFTYDHDPAYWLDYLALGRLRVGVVDGESVAWLDGAVDLRVRNLPGGEGVEAAGTVAGRRVRVEAMPTARGRDTMRWEGSALFRVTCAPAARLRLRWEGIGRTRVFGFHPDLPERARFLIEPGYLPGVGEARVEGPPGAPVARLTAKGLPLQSAVTFHPASLPPVPEGGGLVATARETVGEARLLAAFAEEPARAAALAREDPAAVERACRDRFARLQRSAYIRTPSPALDAAFGAALVNMEYGWARPWGWIEAVHHWPTLYTQQHSMAADWIGQSDRSREMLLTHAARLLPGGQVPQLDTSGRARQDFGGWSQFYVWCVQHAWRHTGDRDFLQRIREPLARVVDQVFAAHDPDGNGLLGFGQQIGNQEDYISTPEDGTSPTIAGIEMKRVQAELARAGGDAAEARAHEETARRMQAALRASLWMPDLGRYAFYRDALGTLHREGQYHTLIWPVLYGLLDPCDSYTSLRHLDDALTGKEGEVYASNNFPAHVSATVGSQAGGQQQPWAALAWARMGDGDRAVRPLEWIARWVTRPANKREENPRAFNAGSWPEVAEEMPAYFTPPAGVYVWGVVEGLFGLSLDRPKGTLDIAPCMPSKWPTARLHLPEFDLAVTQGANRRRVECRTAEPLRHRYRLAIPPASRVWLKLNGRAADPRIETGVRRQFVVFDAGKTRRSVVSLAWQPVKDRYAGPAVVSPGQTFGTTGQAGDVYDPCGVLSDRGFGEDGLVLRVREAVATDADKYGDMGRKLLRRRTVFLKRNTGAGELWQPLDFTVAPAPRPAGKPDVAGPSLDESAMRAYLEAGLRRVALPESLLRPDTEWRSWREWSAYGHFPWAALEPPLQGTESIPLLAPPSVPGLSFANPGRRAAVVSRRIGTPAVVVPLAGKARRVYLLLLGLLDNHDVFAPVGRVSVLCRDGTAFARTLHFPGDLDWWGPKRILAGFATVGQGWSGSPAWEAPSSVMNVVEVDLSRLRAVESVTVEVVGRYPALGIVGVSLLGSIGPEAFAKLPPAAQALAAREPHTLFAFDVPTLAGWEAAGAAWGVGDAATDRWARRGSPFFADSLAHGEQATGTLLSPPFRVAGRTLAFLAGGHGARNHFALVDAATGTELRRAPAPGRTAPFARVAWDVRDLSGRRVRFRAVDAEDGPAYAWLAFDDLTLEP